VYPVNQRSEDQMIKYIFLELEYKYGPHINIKCTDREVLDWIVEIVKSQLPTCKDTRWLAHGFRGDPKPYVMCLHNLENRDDEIRWWVMKLLTENGWEPFQAIPEIDPSRDQYPIRYLLFRKRSELAE